MLWLAREDHHEVRESMAVYDEIMYWYAFMRGLYTLYSSTHVQPLLVFAVESLCNRCKNVSIFCYNDFGELFIRS